MKWTQFFIPTTKESPADAVVPSHQLMIRAGLIRQVSAGAYTYLPLGYRSLRKVEAIVREEMNRAGAIELHMPAMHPIEWWEETGRVEAMGDVLIRLGGVTKDDWRSRTVLGPTHEEVITEIARTYLNSYKQLPISFYQIQTKFRGEARPKSGVLRTREFLMKDAYSFHAAKEGPGGLDETYQKMYDAYCAIFGRCGLPYIPVQADSGPIGGDASHEFMVPTDAGEDYLVQSEDGSYAANVERAEVMPLPDENPSRAREEAVGSAPQQLSEIHTPGCPGIDDVCKLLSILPSQMIKTLVFDVEPDMSVEHGKLATRAHELYAESGVKRFALGLGGTGHIVEEWLVCVRGDHEVNEGKLRRLAGGRKVWLKPPKDDEAMGIVIGYVGPHHVNKYGTFRLVIDRAARDLVSAVVGANKRDHHVRGFNWDRDVDQSRLNEAIVADIRVAVAGDRALNGSPLVFRKCIEVGHVFKLGTKYSQAMQATFLDQNGKSHPFIMGCYGIGLNRIMAAAIEASHDDKGIIWPAAIAPFTVVICALDTREEQVVATATKLHDELEAAGVDVLLDDRDARPGFKFNDADLIGFPFRITVGKKGLAEGVVELTTRRTGETTKLAPAQAVATVHEMVVGAIQGRRLDRLR